MSQPGVDRDDLLTRARSALLDALEALAEQRDAVVVIGAQAIYLRTGGVDVALAEATKDSDLALDPRLLSDDPRVEQAMHHAGFLPGVSNQPGAWVNAGGIPVDLMVPETLAGAGSPLTRGARIPPHDRRAARRARGLEAAVVDNSFLDVIALDPADARRHSVRVAGPAALVVAKLHKIAERVGSLHRLNDKDAHDIYRVLVAIETDELVTAFGVLLEDKVSADATDVALSHLAELFAAGPQALGATMAGRAEEGVGEPETVSRAASILAADLVGRVSAGA
ncbi:MAG: hypothetical protein WCC38_00680 [Pseudonocardiaceae bacterium]